MKKLRIRPLVAVLVLLALSIFAASLGRSDAGPSAGPDGTLALRRFLSAMGIEVRSGETPPQGGTFVLLEDMRDGEDAAEVVRWVAAGGRLVLAEPGSQIAELIGVRGSPPEQFEAGTVSIDAGCAAPVAVRARTIMAAAADGMLRSTDPEVTACYLEDGGAYMIEVPHGRGTAVVLAGRSPFENRLLRQRDNAALALSIVRSPVTFGPPVPAGSAAAPQGLWATLPVAARVMLIQLGIAVVVFAAVRARRLGMPRTESPLAPIPASELVRASARIYRAARATDHAAMLLRASASERIAKRVGAPRGTPDETLATILAERSGASERQIHDALVGSRPVDDTGLIELSRSLEEITSHLEGGT